MSALLLFIAMNETDLIPPGPAVSPSLAEEGKLTLTIHWRSD